MLPINQIILNMAKGNMLLGYARGSVGDVTFARVKGVQTAHARNRNPNNPKTPSQMFQRAKLAAAVNFFKHSLAGFFKFAFEDKKSNESDYNAFMRHNIARTMPSPKIYNGEGGFPITPFVMSQGSLGTFEYEAISSGETIGQVYLPQNATEADLAQPTTVAKLTEIMKRVYPWIQDGDILTFVRYYSTSNGGIYETMPFLRDDDPLRYVVQVEQEILDPNDSDVAADSFNFKNGGAIADENLQFTTPTMDDYTCNAVALIVSRKTAQGLKVTNCELSLAESFNSTYEDCTEGGTDYDTWRDYINQTWEASDEAILAGGYKG